MLYEQIRVELFQMISPRYTLDCYSKHYAVVTCTSRTCGNMIEYEIHVVEPRSPLVNIKQFYGPTYSTISPLQTVLNLRMFENRGMIHPLSALPV